MMSSVGGKKLLPIIFQNSALVFGPMSAGSGGASCGFRNDSTPM